jgi:hypothetical protein
MVIFAFLLNITSSVGIVVGIGLIGAVGATVRVRSPVDATSLELF